MGSTRDRVGRGCPPPRAAASPFRFPMTKFVYFTTARMPKFTSRQPSSHRKRRDLPLAFQALRSSLDSPALCSRNQTSCSRARSSILRAASQVVAAVTPM